MHLTRKWAAGHLARWMSVFLSFCGATSRDTSDTWHMMTINQNVKKSGKLETQTVHEKDQARLIMKIAVKQASRATNPSWAKQKADKAQTKPRHVGFSTAVSHASKLTYRNSIGLMKINQNTDFVRRTKLVSEWKYPWNMRAEQQIHLEQNRKPTNFTRRHVTRPFTRN